MATGTVNFRTIYTRSNLAPGQSQTVAWRQLRRRHVKGAHHRGEHGRRPHRLRGLAELDHPQL